MANNIKAQQDILEKLNIYALNAMQESALAAIEANDKTILLSPTGTGKTLAFLLPLLETLDPECEEVQALIIVPSRELAIQIETVVRNMGSGYKANAIYGGRAISKDKIELKHTPAILIGTPGRLADHFEQARFTTKFIKTLVIDEFDISIEVGAGGEMKNIMSYLANVNKRILTSATEGASIPKYLKMDGAKTLNFLSERPSSKLEIKTVISPSANKHNTLVDLLHHVGSDPGIVFCNKKERLEDLSRFLEKKNIAHTCFYSGMEQHDRERALIKLRNGSVSVLVASDLAARGIDIPEMNYIIHYEMPEAVQEYTHRNGRTARVNSKGTAYLIKGEREVFPDFVGKSQTIRVNAAKEIKPPFWTTLFISGGRKDKISKGDIAGLFFKQGNISKDQLGVIELKQDCAFVAVPVSIADDLVDNLNNTRLKKKKVRVSII
ncbi:superfamily II DNA/RNA helicase [Winogradskyella pacifica]|uniref:Superfamily II DNA/RNA helicase n=1 Tax=Winogradskyella pacifica TaxID=664642 RepID=A0A3D9N6U3_9FLAO|nr:DEAD/DEAH box helicase [Winogradskyella pacifica]REE25943.1 superfamily II DNA/RNA helicase [Winogradskyella pacifica]